MSRKITLADIAEALNTTAATVSRALNGDPSISENTRRQIVAMSKKMHYTPHRIAASLRRGQSGIIGVIIPSAAINFFGSVVHGIEALANENGYHVILYQSNESYASEVKGMEALQSARVDGILVSIAKETRRYDHFLAARQAGTPVVFFDRAKPKIGIHSVVVNDRQGACAATQHLLQQGYRRIAHIAGPQHLHLFKERQAGYCQALEAAGIPLHPEWIYPGSVSIESGRAAIRHFLNLRQKPDAVFAVEDFTALGALKELKDRGIKVPQQFGVVGFANEGFGEHLSPALSSVDQQTIQMGRNAVELLLELMKSGAGNRRIRSHVLEPRLVIRESSLRNTITPKR